MSTEGGVNQAAHGKRRVLMVEDHAVLAMAGKLVLESLGYAVVGPVGTIDAAREWVRQGEFDVALLDVSLPGGDCFDIAEDLESGGYPFMFMTGRDVSHFPERWRHRPLLAKPVFKDDLERALAALFEA